MPKKPTAPASSPIPTARNSGAQAYRHPFPTAAPLRPRDYRAPRPYQEVEAHFGEIWPEQAYAKGRSHWGRSVRAEPHPTAPDHAPHYGHHGWEIDALRHEEDLHDRYMDGLHADRAVAYGQLPPEYAPYDDHPHAPPRPMSSPLLAPPSGQTHRAVRQSSGGRHGSAYGTHSHLSLIHI
eukprot:TRINITY_DN650_c0_g1_i2.p2 TRINITY_DN650_c0_g1~~TRINITY_DN650_c0_g1_i2.p2  ORF type:complete len:180 (-),score=17.31 TRINITY_DN650_c0_g1_i2:164-703(-)